MQHSNLNILANNLNNMKNPKRIGTSIGKVVGLSPLTVSIAGGTVLLTEGEELTVSERLKDKTYACSLKISGGTLSGTLNGESVSITNVSLNNTAEITIKPDIQIGDELVVIPMENEQSWIAIDRIGGNL